MSAEAKVSVDVIRNKILVWMSAEERDERGCHKKLDMRVDVSRRKGGAWMSSEVI